MEVQGPIEFSPVSPSMLHGDSDDEVFSVPVWLGKRVKVQPCWVRLEKNVTNENVYQDEDRINEAYVGPSSEQDVQLDE